MEDVNSGNIKASDIDEEESLEIRNEDDNSPEATEDAISTLPSSDQSDPNTASTLQMDELEKLTVERQGDGDDDVFNELQVRPITLYKV